MKKKSKQGKKIQTMNFAESSVHQKNKCMRQIWDIEFIFF